jgi:hypothetical protein
MNRNTKTESLRAIRDVSGSPIQKLLLAGEHQDPEELASRMLMY